MLLNRFGGFLLLAICIAHFTGATGVSRPESVDRTDYIGVFLEATGNAGEPFLCPPVLRRDMVALRTSPARVLRRHDDQFTSVPRQLFADVCSDGQAALVEIDGEGDHVHLLVEYPSKVAVASLVNSLKGVSSRLLHVSVKKSYVKKNYPPDQIRRHLETGPIVLVSQKELLPRRVVLACVPR